MNVWHLFDSPKRPFLCSDLSKESSSVDRYQLRNIYCYIFLQLDNAMIYMLYRKSWLKWVCRVYTWSTFKASVSPQKSARLAKNQQTSLKTLSCVLYKNTEKYRYLIFKNPGIGIWAQSQYTGIFRYTAGAWWLVVLPSTLVLINYTIVWFLVQCTCIHWVWFCIFLSGTFVHVTFTLVLINCPIVGTLVHVYID